MTEYILLDDFIPDEVISLAEAQDCLRELIRCKDCKHRPIKPDDYETGFDLEFPDSKCPCQCDDDRYYSWYPSENWFCANGERRMNDARQEKGYQSFE